MNKRGLGTPLGVRTRGTGLDLRSCRDEREAHIEEMSWAILYCRYTWETLETSGSEWMESMGANVVSQSVSRSSCLVCYCDLSVSLFPRLFEDDSAVSGR